MTQPGQSDIRLTAAQELALQVLGEAECNGRCYVEGWRTKSRHLPNPRVNTTAALSLSHLRLVRPLIGGTRYDFELTEAGRERLSR